MLENKGPEEKDNIYKIGPNFIVLTELDPGNLETLA